jgi:serine/threonine-protein kinase
MIGMILQNRYELVQKIGEGGMAEVYKAYCNVLNRNVAIKILKRQYANDNEFIKKFEEESKSAAKLNHPNLVNIYDVGFDKELRYIVMELLTGVTLKEYLTQQKGKLSEQKAIDFALQIARAIENAHLNSIIHRDIKPQNIIITNQGMVKVADFGIARAIDTSTIVNTKEMVGSVHYSSPEQIRGGFIDYKTDMYSFGVMLYEMIEGRLPFDGDSAINIAMKHLKENPNPISNPISDSFEKLIQICMSKSPISRFNSFTEIVKYLEMLSKNPETKIDFLINNETMRLPNLDKELKQMENKEVKTKHHISKKKMAISILLAFVLSLVVLGVLFVNLFKEVTSTKSVIVPQLVGLSIEEGKKELDTLGLKYEVIGSRHSTEYPEDYIIEQSENAGATLKEGYVIKVTLSIGENSVDVPKVIQKELSEAKIIIMNSGLMVGDITYQASDLPKDYILSQSPNFGEKLGVEGKVNLVVSQGKEVELTTMPNVEGSVYENSITVLTQSNILIGNILYEFSPTVPLGTIISQSLAANTQVPLDSLVELVVSKGPEQPSEPVLVTKEYIIPLSFDAEKEIVVVEFVQNDLSTIVYSQEHFKTEEKIVVSVTGIGEATINFYFGETLFNTKSENFVNE